MAAGSTPWTRRGRCVIWKWWVAAATEKENEIWPATHRHQPLRPLPCPGRRKRTRRRWPTAADDRRRLGRHRFFFFFDGCWNEGEEGGGVSSSACPLCGPFFLRSSSSGLILLPFRLLFRFFPLSIRQKAKKKIIVIKTRKIRHYQKKKRKKKEKKKKERKKERKRKKNVRNKNFKFILRRPLILALITRMRINVSLFSVCSYTHRSVFR